MPFIRRESPISKEQLEQLYIREQLSMQEIADRLGYSVHKVQYWMDKYGIARRRWDEASYLKHNPNGDPFKIKAIQTDEDRELFNVAIGLFLGEGTKSHHDVRFANSNPQIIRTFLRFLREICGIEERKIFAWLNIFDDVDLVAALAYWQKVTGLSRAQFAKSMVRKSRGGSYLNKSQYGTITICVSNTKLGDKIKQWGEDKLRK